MGSLVKVIVLAGSIISLNVYAEKELIIAKVNKSEISKPLLEKTFIQTQNFVGVATVTKEKVLNDLINRALGVELAQKNKLAEDPTVKEKIEDILFHAQISKDLEGQFKGLTVSDDEVKKYYKDYPEYNTSHILFRMRITPSQPEQEEAMKKALQVFKTLQTKPESFPEVANHLSQASGAPLGGSLGYQAAVRLAPEYFKAVKGHKVGDILPPVRTQFGYHIIKVDGVKKVDDIDFQIYKKIIYDQKRDGVIANYFAQLRKNATIQIDKKALE